MHAVTLHLKPRSHINDTLLIPTFEVQDPLTQANHGHQWAKHRFPGHMLGLTCAIDTELPAILHVKMEVEISLIRCREG